MATDEDVKEKDESEDEPTEEESAESKEESRSRSEAEEAEEKGESRADDDAESDDEESEPEERSEAKEKSLAKAKPDEAEGVDAPMPTQLGHKRFVYAAYLAGGMVVAFVVNKALDYGWYKLHEWKPEALPEPQDEIAVPVAIAVAVGVTLYYWSRTRARAMAEEVAEELTKVTWPTRQDVTNGTTVVVITTLFATVFFALMDQFWLWVTKHVYGS